MGKKLVKFTYIKISLRNAPVNNPSKENARIPGKTIIKVFVKEAANMISHSHGPDQKLYQPKTNQALKNMHNVRSTIEVNIVAINP